MNIKIFDFLSFSDTVIGDREVNPTNNSWRVYNFYQWSLLCKSLQVNNLSSSCLK